MEKQMKYERVQVVPKAGSSDKVLAFISGTSKADVIRQAKNEYRLNIRRNGLVIIDFYDGAVTINSNLL